MNNAVLLISRFFRINSINKKLIYSVILLCSILLAISTFIEIQMSISASRAEIDSKGKTMINLASLSLSDAVWNFSNSGIKAGAEALFNDKEVYSVNVFDLDSNELYKKTREGDHLKIAGLVSFKSSIESNGKKIGTIELQFTKYYLNQIISNEIKRSIIINVITIVLLILIISAISKSVTRPLKELIAVTGRITNGDYMCRSQIKSNDEIGVLSAQFNIMAQSVCDNLIKLKDSSTQMENYIAKLRETNSRVTETSSSVTNCSSDLAATAEELNATIEEIASSANIVSQVVTQVFVSVLEVSRKSKGIAEISSEGKNIIHNNISKINAVSAAFEDITTRVNGLFMVSKEIKNFVNIISNISSQTNLIALNAAIEAARAGIYGKGFAVVADEIRKLSDQSANATKEINQLINHIDEGIKLTVAATENGRIEVNKGVELTVKTGDFMNEINNSIADTVMFIRQIEDESKEANEGVKHVAVSCDEFARVIEQVVLSSQELSSLAVNLFSTSSQTDDYN